jgi:hypothetical protein
MGAGGRWPAQRLDGRIDRRRFGNLIAVPSCKRWLAPDARVACPLSRPLSAVEVTQGNPQPSSLFNSPGFLRAKQPQYRPAFTTNLAQSSDPKQGRYAHGGFTPLCFQGHSEKYRKISINCLDVHHLLTSAAVNLVLQQGEARA